MEIGKVVTHALNGRPLRPDAPRHDADRVCEQALYQLTRETGLGDDITVLAAVRTDPPAPLRLDLPARTRAIDEAAEQLDRWLVTVHAGDHDRVAVRHAAVEVVTNSVEHGTTHALDVDVRIRLTAHLDPDGTATIVVADTGGWVEPRHSPLTATSAQPERPFRGLGLALVAELVDTFTLDHDATGTIAVLRHALRRPAPILTGSPTLHEPVTRVGDADLGAYAPTDRPGTVVVRGPVLATTVDTLRSIVELESRGGTQPLVVDLTAVTHLASAGVRVLQQTLHHADAQGTQITLLASPGDPAHQVLALVGIPVTRPGEPEDHDPG